MSKPRAAWVDTGFLPAFTVYIPTAGIWAKEQKRLRVGPSVYVHDRPEFRADAYCTRFDRDDKPPVMFITLADKVSRLPMQNVVGLIAHECMHAWRFTRERMGEDEPSLEFEAYALQRMVIDVTAAHRKMREKPWKAPR